MDRCTLCLEPATRRLQHDSSNGPCDWPVCDPCLASRIAQTWQGGRNYIVDGKPVQDISRFVSQLPKRQKCAGCGARCNEAHWHFVNDGSRKSAAVRHRAYYCDRDCCDSPNCAAATDPDEFVFGDNDWDDLLEDEEEVAEAKAKGYTDDDEELDWDDEDEAAVAGAADDEDEWDF